MRFGPYLLVGATVLAQPIAAQADSVAVVGDVGLHFADPKTCGEYVVGGSYCTGRSWELSPGGGIAAQYAYSIIPNDGYGSAPRGWDFSGWRGRRVMDASLVADASVLATPDVVLGAAAAGFELQILHVWKVQILGGYTLASNPITTPDRDGQPQDLRLNGFTFLFATGFDVPVWRTAHRQIGLWAGIRWPVLFGTDMAERLSLALGLSLQAAPRRRRGLD
jgi:hypothetical protein